jgi:hypothetical protein
VPLTVRERLAALDLPGTVRFGAPSIDPVRRLPVGIAALDALLDGGLPRGHLSEIVGGPSSGRTAVLHALLAATTRAGAVAALVDLPDALDPPSLARAGAVLERILWVRPPAPRLALQCAELILAAGGFAVVALDLDRAAPGRPVPRAAWLRLAQAARGAAAAGVVLGRRQTGAAAALALRLHTRRVRWNDRLLDGLATTATVSRSRFGAAERLASIVVGEELAGFERQLSLVSRDAVGGDTDERQPKQMNTDPPPPPDEHNPTPPTSILFLLSGVGRLCVHWGGSGGDLCSSVDLAFADRCEQRMRLACLRARFPLAAWLRAEPSCAGAVAIADGDAASAARGGVGGGRRPASPSASARRRRCPSQRSDGARRVAGPSAPRTRRSATSPIPSRRGSRMARRARSGSTPTASASSTPASMISRRRRCAAPPRSGSRRRSASPAARSPPSWRRATAAAARWCRRATSGGCWRRCRSISCRRRRRCARR